MSIECHCCGRGVEIVRSVMLRGDVEKLAEEYIERTFPGQASEPIEITQEEFKSLKPGYDYYKRNVVYRRAFICEACYKKIDSEPVGAAEIFTPGGAKVFGLAGASRHGRAAVYNEKKWRRFQARLAKQMGLSTD